MNRIVPFISLCVLSLFVHRNTRDFCVLILHPATLPYSLMSSNSFLAASLGFSMYSITSSANGDNLTSFPIWIPFISLIAIAWTFKTVLNKKGKSGHPCLLPDLRGNAFRFSPLSMMLAVGLSNVAFIMLRNVPVHSVEKCFVLFFF